MSKLDRLVAERVFGWSIVAASDGEPIWSNDCGTPLAFQYASAPVKFGPHFSREIAAAWDVVEHLRKQTKESGARKYLVSILDHPNTFEVVVENHDTGDSVYACDESAPMAICLAALRAVGVDEQAIQEAMR